MSVNFKKGELKMAKTKKRYYKNYTPEERAAYHATRLKSGNGTDNQLEYSRNFINGYTDEYYKNNLSGSLFEYEKNKKYISDLKSTIQSVKHTNKYNLGAYINGLKARQNKK